MSEVKYDFERNAEQRSERTKSDKKIQDTICEILKLVADKGFSVKETVEVLSSARWSAEKYIDKNLEAYYKDTKFSDIVLVKES